MVLDGEQGPAPGLHFKFGVTRQLSSLKGLLATQVFRVLGLGILPRTSSGGAANLRSPGASEVTR